MCNILIQFHATRDELLAFIGECMRDYGVRVTAIRSFPYNEFHAYELAADDLSKLARDQRYETFAFTVRPPNLDVADFNKFRDRNPSALMLEIGVRSRRGLKESSLCGGTDRKRSSMIWQKIAQKLRKRTLPDKLGFRYTPKCKLLQDQGVTMLCLAGQPTEIGTLSPKKEARKKAKAPSQRARSKTLHKRGKYWYGDSHADLSQEIWRYSKRGYPAEHFANAICTCGGKVFKVLLNEDEGVAVRECVHCGHVHPIGDSEEYLQDATLEECECVCKAEQFEVTVGVALYEDSEDVRWLYLGCRCVACSLVAVYGDWKNEFEGYQDFLAKV